MSKHQESFPVLSIDRDDVEYTLGFDPELTDERMEILTARLHDVLQEKGFNHILEDTLDELTKSLGIVVPTVEIQPKCLDASPAAEQILQDFKESLRQIQDEITNLEGASFACFPFAFSQGNPTCRGEGETTPGSPVCELCRELHGFDPEYKEYEGE